MQNIIPSHNESLVIVHPLVSLSGKLLILNAAEVDSVYFDSVPLCQTTSSEVGL